MKAFPGSAPAGILIRAGLKPPAAGLVARQAAEVSGWSSLTSARRDDLARYGLTQEVYLSRNYRALLDLYLEALGGREEATAARLRELAAQL